ncbi:DUF421 domain-containing protein [Mesonia mobilis]|mgnify:FL=1|uniref:DUF421 domain-containing protein n=1 Tax=Mesonia mobilis TaxID=369791 RepID=UPI0024BB45E8|nr:YetF domain-containing protein [Mesonia mobilis]
MLEKLLIGDYESLISIVVTAPIIYVSIIFYIRIFGKRTTSQMNSFDWIVTVAMGSLVASTVILKDVSVIAGALAIFILMSLQFVLTKLMVRSKKVRELVRATPELLFFDGEFIMKNMRQERITKPEVYAAIRESGLPNINEVYAVVLETDAKFSVIGMSKSNSSFSLADVEGLPNGLKEDLKKVKDSGKFPSAKNE